MNMKISYMYRDGSNWKRDQYVIVKGVLSERAIKNILECCDEGEYFIPRQVGFPEKRIDDNLTSDDHCWFELEENDFEIVSEQPTINMTAEDVIQKFHKAKRIGWDQFSWLNDHR